MPDSFDRQNVVCAHITQDDFGYWMTSFETKDGALVLSSYAAASPDHEILHAFHPQEIGLPAATEFRVSLSVVPMKAADSPWTKPQPRRVGEPYYTIKNGMRVY